MSQTVELGVDALFEHEFDHIRGARVGVVASAASVDADLENIVDRLARHPEVRLAALFAPEHGLRGEAGAGEEIQDGVDPQTGVVVHSLYGRSKRPRADSLEGLDALIIDLVDVGCRYWTFPYTAAYCLEAAAESGLKVIVLDRPNPVTGTRIEGNLLDPAFASFVGRYPVPMRTSLTLGEAARLFNESFGIGADLHVVRCRNWRREMWYDETGHLFVPPSPNAPTLEMLTLYPGTCLLEGTNISEGRGTTRPFEVVGAPWIDAMRLAHRLKERALPGVAFRALTFRPAYHKHEGITCGGVQIHIVDRDAVHAVRTGLHVLHAIREENPGEFSWRGAMGDGGRPFIDLLAGTDRLRLDIDAGRDPDEILEEWERELDAFVEMRERVMLY